MEDVAAELVSAALAVLPFPWGLVVAAAAVVLVVAWRRVRTAKLPAPEPAPPPVSDGGSADDEARRMTWTKANPDPPPDHGG